MRFLVLAFFFLFSVLDTIFVDPLSLSYVICSSIKFSLLGNNSAIRFLDFSVPIDNLGFNLTYCYGVNLIYGIPFLNFDPGYGDSDTVTGKSSFAGEASAKCSYLFYKSY